MLISIKMFVNILLIFGIVVVAQSHEHTSSEGNKPILVLQPDLVSLITRKEEICVRESGASPAVTHQLLPWKLEESEVNGKFLLCLAKEMEFYDKDGKVMVDKFIDLFYDSLKSQDVELYRILLARCNELTGPNDYYTIYKIANCFYTKSPVKIALHVLVY
ncbi:PREDICTED: uncharacterized protein LOC106111827 [Papilio polytes]|uniref:uncharacterized protein LOC106111827 n=1 Tax=Papilio polytes TaxID=76194 RepID=UPI000676182D|nr:PREDICTED: uncharacterized protein LOC106111827 [Papilio polytes]